MKRFAMEHLPRSAATYRVNPIDFDGARAWFAAGQAISLVRTTEMIGAIQMSLGVALEQSDVPMALQPGDEALLVSLSFSVLLAWAQGRIVPLQDDWRFLLISVEETAPTGASLLAASQDLATEGA
jgi:hypothetical protein